MKTKFLTLVLCLIMVLSSPLSMGCMSAPTKEVVSIVTIVKTDSTDGVDTYTIVLSNGEKATFTVNNGKDGRGIEKTEIVNGELIIHYTDGTSANLGRVVGENGQNGNNGSNGENGANGSEGRGIEKTEIVRGELIVHYTDGTSVNLGKVVGENGQNGTNGENGRGISKVEIVNGELVIYYTDGTSDNLGKISDIVKDDDSDGDSSEQTPPESGNHKTETRPLVFGISGVEGNINPFFVNSKNAMAVVDKTQIKMLSTSSNGLPVCGENEPCVVLDYTTSYFDKDGNPTPNGTMYGTTEYEFVIKNGIKFSDGQPLTIKDALFNLYVYLDPAYSGSSTIYSTDIIGLKAYRAQDPSLSDGADLKKTFYSAAQQRIQNLRDFWNGDTDTMTEQMEADVDTIKKLFKEEVTTDWTNSAGSVKSYQEEGFTFTEDWQVYFYVEGNVGYRTKMNENGATVKMRDANGKYITTLDDDPTTTEIDETSTYYEEVANASSEAKINEYITAHPKSEASDMTDAEYKEYVRQLLIKEWAINVVYESYTSTYDGLNTVASYWATAMNALEEFANEEMSAYFESAGKKVKTISGITTHKTSNFNGKDLGEQHDVLSIKINGIDPKAIWNFAFTVTPMHYYSGSYEGVNYVETFNAEEGNFGLKFRSYDFMDTVIAAEEKNMLPMGAGTYKASSANGKAPTKETFFKNDVIYYERNTYFETVGNGISNAKIKYFQYKIVGEDGMLQELASGGIDFGEPSATTENVSEVGKHGHLAYKMYESNSYGYVGINPKAIKNVYIRRAIMHSFDTSIIIYDYYKGALAKTIVRPMSATSWAYPKDAEEYYDLMMYERNYVEFIQGLLRTAGCKEGNDLNDAGVRIWKDKDGKNLKFTFTIAGETEDHPAFSMFKCAEQALEKAGFDISVKTDIQALKKLATGDLEVWAGEMQTGIDPDMYQVYHKDSTATSVRNWGYPQILNSTNDTYEYEYSIIQVLSKKIEEGRETLVQSTRESIYADCLDLVMELAVEFPTYQCNDLTVYNKNVIDITTLNNNPTHYEGVVSKLWEVNYN